MRIDHVLISPTDRNRGALGFSSDRSLFSIDRLNEEQHPILSPENALLWDSFPHILAGTPVLIHNGEKVQNIFEESLPERFVYEKFTRSCIAFLPSGHWLIIFIGQPGMTLYELQDLMLELGAEHALNLDGGSSSTLYYKGHVLSSNPYLERLVGNALLFCKKT